MARVTAFEAKTRFGELLDRVSKGEEVVITRHDKPVARLVPEGAQRLDEVRRSVAGLRDLQQRIRRRSKARLTDRESARGDRTRPAMTRDFIADASVAVGWVHRRCRRRRPARCWTPSPTEPRSKCLRCGRSRSPTRSWFSCAAGNSLRATGKRGLAGCVGFACGSIRTRRPRLLAIVRSGGRPPVVGLRCRVSGVGAAQKPCARLQGRSPANGGQARRRQTLGVTGGTPAGPIRPTSKGRAKRADIG